MPQLFDPQFIQSQLEADRPWSAYALADLDPAYFPFTTWFCAGDHSAMVLVYRAFTRTIVLYAGGPEGVSSVMDEVDVSLGRSTEFYAVARPDILPLLTSRYDIREKRSSDLGGSTAKPQRTPRSVKRTSSAARRVCAPSRHVSAELL